MRRWIGSGLITVVSFAASAQWVEPTADTPAYFLSVPKGRSPAILSGAQLTGPFFSHPFQVAIYKMAAAVSPVLFQQPCHCRCDRALRHKSLHSCFETLHGATCATCMREAAYAYQETQKGMTAAQIRAGIERGEWQAIDLQGARF